MTGGPTADRCGVWGDGPGVIVPLTDPEAVRHRVERWARATVARAVADLRDVSVGEPSVNRAVARPPEAATRRFPLPSLLVGLAVVVCAIEALGALALPFSHVRLVTGLVLLLAVLAAGSSRWPREPLREAAWVRMISELGLVAGLLGLLAVAADSPEALSLTVVLLVFILLLGAIHGAVVEGHLRRRQH